jgi:hypothetical protein
LRPACFTRLISTWRRCCLRTFPSFHKLYSLNIWTAYNSRSRKYEKPPCATPSLTSEPSANFLGATLSPSSGASVRCERLKLTLRYLYLSFDTTRCLLTSIYFFKILKESQLREDTLHSFANRTRAVCLRRRRHSSDST